MEVPVARVPSRPTFSRPPFAPAARAAPPPFPRAQLSAPAAAGGTRGAGGSAGAGGARGASGAGVAPATGARAARDVRSAEPRRRPAPDELLPNAVLVTGYPPYTKPQDLAHAFCKFGSVRLNHDWVSDTAACLEFSQPEHAQAAIRASRDVNIYGTFLTVTACTVNTRPQRQPRRREPRVGRGQTFKGTIVEPSKIPLQGAFHQQLDALLSAVRLTQNEIERLGHLYRDLEYVLGEIWPGCRAVPFGSVTTGLGVKSSDADCFVALPRGAARDAVGRARRALQAHPAVFGELLAIPRANTPIVKFVHRPTGVSCDLSFKTPLGSRNSELIAFLLFSDPRLIPVAVAVKYWARVHDLTGTGKLTNYALTMMIVFYFQQAAISVLPAVEWLQRDRGYDCFVDYWNTGFVNDSRRIPRSTNASSIAELLGGFFEYYANFDFERLVVCPFLGRTVKKDDFRDLALLPEEFFLYKKNVSEKVTLPIRFMTPMCVQDPFEQCHNVASAVGSRLAADIRAYFKFAADAYEREKLRDYSGLLPTILLEKPDLPRAKKGGAQFSARLPPGLIGNIAAVDWKAVVRDVAFQVFESILRVELQKVEDENDKSTDTVKRGKPTKLGEASNETESSKAGNLVKSETAKTGKVAIPKETANPVKKSEDTPKSEESTKRVNEIAIVEGTVRPHNEASKSEETPKAEGKKRVSESTEKPKVEIIKNGRVLGGITRREKERYTGAITRAIWKRKMFSKLYSVMGLKFLDRETMITDEIMKVDKNVIDVKFEVLLTFINAPRFAIVSIRHTAGELNLFKEFGKFFNKTFQQWFVILYKPYCKKSLQNAVTDNTVPMGTDEEAAAKELKEAIKAEIDDKSDSDSDSDFSYEDERIDPNATNSEDVAESQESTKLSDTDKNSKNRSNVALKKHSENGKNSDTQKNYANKIRTAGMHDEDELNPSDKSPRKRKNKTQHTDKNKDQQIDHLNDIVGALNLVDKSPRKSKGNTQNHDINAHVQTVADDQSEGNESQNKPPQNRSRTPHGDHNGTCREIPKTKSPRHRHRKGKDKTQSAPTEESGRTRSAGENGQIP